MLTVNLSVVNSIDSEQLCLLCSHYFIVIMSFISKFLQLYYWSWNKYLFIFRCTSFFNKC